MRTACLADPIAKEHDTIPGHPERPARWDAAIRGLGDTKLTEVPVREAKREELVQIQLNEQLIVELYSR